MAAVGAGNWKPELPTLRVAFAGTRLDGVLPAWQVSQVVPVGKCDVATAGDVLGITITLLMPKKLLPVILGPWQVAQPLVIPAWLNWAPENVVIPAMAPLAGISMEGTLLTWHVSHAAEAGTWAGVKLAVVLGLTPKKVPAATLLP